MNQIEISVTGINPQTDNEYLFYNFVQFEPALFLEKWYEKAKYSGLIFKPQYESAILQKIRTGSFENPHSFPEYFDNKFDFIAIDFETANQNRVSACALGLVFIKDNKVAHQIHFPIKPPEEEKFTSRHMEIHGITEEDVEYALSFDELWEIELSEYFNHNLIVFHNASMDLSVLKNLFEYYSISDFEIQYIDTMQLADRTGHSKKLSELAEIFDIEYIDRHNPIQDAKVCAFVFGELTEIYPNYLSLIGKLTFGESYEKMAFRNVSNHIKNQNLDYIQVYSLADGEFDNLEIRGKGFIFTGEIATDRDTAKKIIQQFGGMIKSNITSKVDYVIIGVGYGWSKIQKVHELNEKRKCNIKILTNSDFNRLIEKYSPHNSSD